MSGIMNAENWIADMAPNVRDALAAQMTVTDLPAGTVIKSAGDAPEALFAIVSGYVRLLGADEDGRQVLLTIYQPGNNFGETPMVAKRPFGHTTVAFTDVRLKRLSEASFWDVFSRHPEIATALMRKFEANTSRALLHRDMKRTRRLRSMVAHTLINLAEECGERLRDGSILIPLPITQSDIAEHLEATRQAVQREIGEMKAAGLISKSDGRWQVTSIEKLRTL